MTRRSLPIALTLFAALAAAAPPAVAQTPPPVQLTPGGPPATTPAVPAPPPRPSGTPVPPAWNAPAQPRAAPATPPATPPAAAAPVPAPPGTSASQAATLRRITEAYNAMREMNGRFTQVEANGRRTTGRFYISKPGKIRFVYDRPSRLDIVADGRDVVVRDRGLNTQDLYPLSQTPLRYLLNDRIDLTRDAKVVNVFNDQDMVSVTIEERTQFTEGQLTLYFDASDFQLRQWTITDARGNETSVAVEGLQTNQRNNPNLFEIERNIQVGPQGNR